MSAKDPVFVLCDQVRETAFALHKYLGPGHLEKVYQNGLLHRLRKQGLTVANDFELDVFDEDGTVLGHLEPDLHLSFPLIVELKAVRAITDEHIAQLLGYLRATRVEHGLLFKFGAPKLQVRKYVLTAT